MAWNNMEQSFRSIIVALTGITFLVTAIALEAEIGPGFDGSGSGNFRWRVRPL